MTRTETCFIVLPVCGLEAPYVVAGCGKDEETKEELCGFGFEETPTFLSVKKKHTTLRVEVHKSQPKEWEIVDRLIGWLTHKKQLRTVEFEAFVRRDAIEHGQTNPVYISTNCVNDYNLYGNIILSMSISTLKMAYKKSLIKKEERLRVYLDYNDYEENRTSGLIYDITPSMTMEMRVKGAPNHPVYTRKVVNTLRCLLTMQKEIRQSRKEELMSRAENASDRAEIEEIEREVMEEIQRIARTIPGIEVECM